MCAETLDLYIFKVGGGTSNCSLPQPWTLNKKVDFKLMTVGKYEVD